MKERLLVLAKASPIESHKYKYLVCVAGITENGEWRRIFPIPWDTFRGNNDKKFKKKMWIEYELRDNKSPDGRPESRKIKGNTIQPLYEESYNKINKMLKERLTNLEELQNKKRGECSLGVIKPMVEKMVWVDKKEEDCKNNNIQLTLEGLQTIKLEPMDKKFQYVFRCSPSCPKKHKIICEDWELEELYRKLKKNYNDEKIICKNVVDKFMSILDSEYSYFIVGTHNVYNTWLIISVIYPKKKDINLLKTKTIDEYF